MSNDSQSNLSTINKWSIELKPTFEKDISSEYIGRKHYNLAIIGEVSGSKKFPNGTFIKTSLVQWVKKENTTLTIKTIQGEIYILLYPDDAQRIAIPRIRLKLKPMFDKILPAFSVEYLTHEVNKNAYS